MACSSSSTKGGDNGTGGAASGGTGARGSTGGASNGTGAASSGGSASGGVTTGGTTTGGAATGGSASGGSAGESGRAGQTGDAGEQADEYPGHGFVMHEWGTDTVVVGSNGALLPGLHHEEEDLPSFVYDRARAAKTMNDPSVIVKMETPVNYFYSDLPRSVRASVSFPKGVFTQWYPAVTLFAPPVVAELGANGPVMDPVFDPAAILPSAQCKARYDFANGLIDWGEVEILPRGVSGLNLPDAPLEKFSWSYARQVASNPVRIANGEVEQFLFYRGLGNFEPPLRVTAERGGTINLENTYAETVGTIIALNVDATRAAFTVQSGSVASRAKLGLQIPNLSGARPLDEYAGNLAEVVAERLRRTGLYRDEAQAMVNTWKRQWFRTPGVRILYFAPQNWTEASIPLTLKPEPDSRIRVMVIRVEVISPEVEEGDVAALRQFGTAPDATKAYFQALGRFTEPRLRRALELAPDAQAEALLTPFTSRRGASAIFGQ